jgi:ABC-type lipoprotein export system ATPase subunit
MIQLIHVNKTYQLGGERVRALDDVSLSIKEKEFVGILGTSGSGKSTLMHMLGLLDTPTSGKLIIGDKDVAQLSDDEISNMRSRYIGFVFQQFNLINQLTVLENILLPTLYSKKELDYDPGEKAVDILNKFGIYDRRDFLPNKISGGQQQRVAIARSLIMDPEIILADEPTGNLDSKTGNEILKILADLNHELGVTVIVVTHDKAVAKETRRQIYIKDGRIVNKYS